MRAWWDTTSQVPKSYYFANFAFFCVGVRCAVVSFPVNISPQKHCLLARICEYVNCQSSRIYKCVIIYVVVCRIQQSWQYRAAWIEIPPADNFENGLKLKLFKHSLNEAWRLIEVNPWYGRLRSFSNFYDTMFHFTFSLSLSVSAQVLDFNFQSSSSGQNLEFLSIVTGKSLWDT